MISEFLRARLVLGVAVALLGAAVASAQTESRAVGDEPQRKAQPPAVEQPVTPRKVPTTQPAAKRTGKKAGCGDATPAEVEAAKRGAQTQGDTTGAKEGPRFAVDKEIDVAGEVWSGSSATFSFTIRNEGTQDLTIKAKGG